MEDWGRELVVSCVEKGVRYVGGRGGRKKEGFIVLSFSGNRRRIGKKERRRRRVEQESQKLGFYAKSKGFYEWEKEGEGEEEGPFPRPPSWIGRYFFCLFLSEFGWER